jgi:membrane-associated phospholipid phosphatase
MAIQDQAHTDLAISVVDVAVPKAWDGRLAYVISQVGSPVAVAVTAWTLRSPRAWMWAGIYVLLAVLFPLLYLVWMVRRGQITDLDVQLRKQRARPLAVTIACGGLAWLALMLGGAPWHMVILARTLFLQTAVILGVTLYWKISVHCAAAAGVATWVWSLGGTPLPLLIGVPVIAWSRVRLGRHTLAQTIAGALLGIASFASVLLLVRGG